MSVIRCLLPIALLAASAPAHATLLTFEFDIVVDEEGLEEGPFCLPGDEDTDLCIPGIEVGQTGTLRHTVDTASGLPPPFGPFDYWNWTTSLVTPTVSFTHGGEPPFEDPPTFISSPAWFEFSDGPDDILTLVADTFVGDGGGGATFIWFHDATGSAFGAADIGTQDARVSWLLNTFDVSLFDSGQWEVTNTECCGGARGRILVPEPSSMALLALGLLLIRARTRRRY